MTEYYNPTGNPPTASQGLSAIMRAEFVAIEAGTALLPTLAGNAGKAVVVNPGGAALTVTTGQLALAGNLSTTGAFNTSLIQGASVALTLPVVNATLATLAGTETLSGKTLVSPALTGTPIAPTVAPGTNNAQIATTAFDAAAIAVETARAEAAEALLAPLASPALTGVPTAPTAAPGTNNAQLASTAFIAAAIGAAGVLPAGTITGLTLSNDTGTPNTVLDIAAGRAADSLNAIVIVLGSPVTKSISAPWVTGTGNGGMGTGLTATASTWYHVFAIVVAAVVNVYFDTSIAAANKPAGTTALRYMGSFFLDGSAHILPFVQNGDRFDWVTPITSFSGAPGVTTAITLAVATPIDIATEAILTGSFTIHFNGDALYVSALYQADVVPGAGALTDTGALGVSGWSARVFTNTSSSVRARTTDTSDLLLILTNGWIDTRGK